MVKIFARNLWTPSILHVYTHTHTHTSYIANKYLVREYLPVIHWLRKRQTLASFNSKLNTNKSVKSEDKLFPYSNLFFYDLYKSTWRYSCSYSNFKIKRVHSIKKGSLRGPNIISIAVRKECYIRPCLYHNTKDVSFAFSIHFIVSVVVHKDFAKKNNIPNN